MNAKRKRSIWLTVLIILVVLAGLGLFFAERTIKQKLESITIQGEHPVEITVKDVDLGIFSRKINLDQLTISDSVGNSSGTIRSVRVNGIRWMSSIWKKKLVAQGLIIESPNFTLHLPMPEKTRKGKKEPPVILDDLVVTDGNVSLFFPSDNGVSNLEVSDLSAEMKMDHERLFKFIGGNIKWNDISYTKEGSRYGITAGNLELDFEDEFLDLDSFQLIPSYSKYEFAKEVGFRTGRIEALVPEIKIRGIDLAALVIGEGLRARHIECIGAEVDMFSDKRIPVDEERYVPMFSELLKKSELPIWIDSFQVKNSYLHYSNIHPTTEDEGYLEFKSAYISAYNIVNVEEALLRKSTMEMDLYALFQEKGELSAHFQFFLQDPDYAFHWNGSLGTFRLAETNSFTIPVINLEVVSGYAESLTFDVKSTNKTSEGILNFSYDHLKVEAINPEKHKERKFMTFVANKIFLHKENIPGDKKYKQGEITYNRETNRGFWHFVWTSLECGILTTILPPNIALKVIHAKPDQDNNTESGGADDTELTDENQDEKPELTREEKKALRKEKREKRKEERRKRNNE
jgi:hypothetical protein